MPAQEPQLSSSPPRRQEPTSRLLERAATQLSSPPRPAPREPVALLYERSLELSLLYQQECGRQCERRISDPILSDISDDHSATTMPLLMSFFKSVWRENEALQARAAEPVPLDPAHPGSSAALIQAVSAWHTAHGAIEEHLRTAQQSTQAAHSLGHRGSSSSSSSSSAEPAPPPSPSSSSSYTLLPDVHVALLDTALDPFPAQVHMHTQHWLAVHGEVQRLGVEEEERRSQLASQLARLGTISASLASMRAHLLRGEDGTPLAIPTQAAAAAAAAQPALLSPAAEAAARAELAALAQSRGRALALADHQRALTQLQADLAAALAEQSQRLPAAQAALPALFLQQAEAEAGQAEAVAEQRLARARAAVGALQARLGLLELQHRVASLMRVRRQRLADWVSVMAARPGKGTLFPAGEGGVGGRKAFSLTSLRALAAGAGAPRAAGSSSSSSGEAASGSSHPMSLSDAKRRLAGEVAEQRQLAAGALQAMGYAEGLALWLEEGLRRLLPPEQEAEE